MKDVEVLENTTNWNGKRVKEDILFFAPGFY